MKGISMHCILLLAVLTASLFASAPVNIYTNSGFETTPDGATYGWGFENVTDSGAVATRTVDSTSGTAHEGKNFCRITVTKTATDSNGLNWHVQMKDPSWPAKKGMVYHFSIWARANVSKTIGLSVYGDSTSIYVWRATTPMNLTTEWKQFHQIFTSDVQGTGRLNFALVCGGSVGVYDFDEAVLIEEPPTENIYENGGFEADAAGWNLWVDPAGTGAAEFDFTATGAKEGTKFCRINVASAAEDDHQVQLQDGLWTAKIDYEYTFSFWAKADSERTITVAAQAGDTREYTRLVDQIVNLTTEWVKDSITYYSTDLAGGDSINFVIYCGAQVGKYDFDGVTLVGVGPSGIHRHHDVRQSTFQPTIFQIVSDRLHGTAGAMTSPLNVQIFSIQGRLQSRHTVTPAGGSFDLPLPPSGAWVVRSNGQRSVIVVP